MKMPVNPSCGLQVSMIICIGFPSLGQLGTTESARRDDYISISNAVYKSNSTESVSRSATRLLIIV